MAEQVDGTTTLVLVSAIFVLLMTIPGLALFYGSLVSRKNLIDTMLQSVILTGTIPILWWFVAYSLCFAEKPSSFFGYFGGTEKAFLSYSEDAVYSGISESAWCVFQLTFGIITAAIATGAVAERSLLWPMIVLANLWLLVVYCPICHMVWGDGILMRMGVLDTAGGLVVETCSGLTAVVLCYFVGPRRAMSEEADPVRGVLHIVGAALLWVGWLAFNGGSAFTSGARASTTTLNTLLAGSAGGLGWLLCGAISECRGGLLNLTATFHLMGGAVAGLCAATPSSGFVDPTGSVMIGAGAGILCFLADQYFLSKVLRPCGIDDVVSVFPVHGVGGLWGTIMTGVLAKEEVGGVKGAIEGNWEQVYIQFFSMAVVSLWTVLGTSLVAGVVSTITTLRASETEETHGLDIRPHGKESSEKMSKLLQNCDPPSSDEETGEATEDQDHCEPMKIRTPRDLQMGA